ncbi:hypothetical protein [Arvimicrobium flavum]|uniref:hypothetical protein n=1 Tax=Arvimicrobium flavum TaxID=3393320 RepID=UPI00237BC309|nr:hypothetical protein [Mesorhizobium shangrilense]
MAVIRAYAPTDMIHGQLPSGYVTRATSSEVVISDGNAETSIRGHGFTYAGSYVTGGIVTSYVVTYGGAVAFEGHGFNAHAPIVAEEILTRDPVGLFSYALAGNDDIYGSAYSDRLAGYAGDDWFDPWSGDDDVYGGAGFDTVYLSGSLGDYQITPAAPGVFHVVDVNLSNGSEGYDILYDVEALHFANGTSVLLSDFAPRPAWHQLSSNVEIVAATYQFFLGWVPNSGGFAYLISSPDNQADLSDAYYAHFNTENRYINFASNLGTAGDGKSWFDAEFGSLSFEQAVALAYEEIMGKPLTGGAYNFFMNAHGFYEDVAEQRVVRPGVDLDDATKIVAIGSVLNEAVKSGLGPYAEAIDELLADVYPDGQSMMLGQDLFAFV